MLRQNWFLPQRASLLCEKIATLIRIGHPERSRGTCISSSSGRFSSKLGVKKGTALAVVARLSESSLFSYPQKKFFILRKRS
jgi:hypothetical protein